MTVCGAGLVFDSLFKDCSNRFLLVMGECSWVDIVFIDAVRSVFVLSQKVFVPVVPIPFWPVRFVLANSAHASLLVMVKVRRPSSTRDRAVKMFITVLFMSVVSFALLIPGWFVWLFAVPVLMVPRTGSVSWSSVTNMLCHAAFNFERTIFS